MPYLLTFHDDGWRNAFDRALTAWAVARRSVLGNTWRRVHLFDRAPMWEIIEELATR